MRFKKKIAFVLAFSIIALLLVSCEQQSEVIETKRIKRITLGFVPSHTPEEIIETTEPLKDLLKNELKKDGLTVDNIDITVGSSYDAVGEGLVAGTIDVAFLPGGYYVKYDQSASIILTAVRQGISLNYDDAKSWNDARPTKPSATAATSYRSLILAGPSAKGREMARKIRDGEKIEFEELNKATWCIMSKTSAAGYVYPSIWLREQYAKSLTDLKKVVYSETYSAGFARLASGQVDVLATYADARIGQEKNWRDKFGRQETIWDVTDVIGVSPPIPNEAVCVSKNSKQMTSELKASIQKALIGIGHSDAGKKVLEFYSQTGYQEAKSQDYDSEREAQKIYSSISKP